MWAAMPLALGLLVHPPKSATFDSAAAVKRETAKLVRDVLEHTPKPVVLKLRDSVLPAVAKLADAGDNEVREAAQAALVAFAVRAGSMGILDKVRGLGSVVLAELLPAALLPGWQA
jgi:hypothetical protein